MDKIFKEYIPHIIESKEIIPLTIKDKIDEYKKHQEIKYP